MKPLNSRSVRRSNAAPEILELNAIRLERDLTYRDMADSIGISHPLLHRLLNLPNPPDVNDRTLYKIRKFLATQTEEVA